jgi:hypothetical protein
MSMLQRAFETNIAAVSKNNNKLLVLTESKVLLLDLASNQIEYSLERGDLDSSRVSGVQLISTSPLVFHANRCLFEVIESKITKKGNSSERTLSYSLKAA